MRLIDTHCHLDFPEFDRDRPVVLQNARRQGVSDLVIPAVTAANWPRVLALRTRVGPPQRPPHASEAGPESPPECGPILHAALGLHPCFLAHHQRADIDCLRSQLQQAQVTAIGEIGLDFARADADRAAQRWYFEQQLGLASALQLPVLLHVRKAHDEALRMLRASALPGGIAHAFNGSPRQAEGYLELGFKLGFGGMLTFERSVRLRQLARALPIQALVLETDAPDMTVASHQYQRNSPEYLPEILAALAAIHQQSPEEIAAITTANAVAVLGLDKQ